MTKREFFLRAMRDGAYVKRDWLLSIMNVTLDAGPDYPWSVSVDIAGKVTVNAPEGPVVLEEAYPGVPIVSKGEPLTLDVGDLPTVRSKVNTSYYEAIFNMVVFYWAFGDKWDYLPGAIKLDHVEKKILIPRLVSDPKTPEEEETIARERSFTCTELVAHSKAVGFIRGLAQTVAPSGSRATFVPNPDILAYRDKRFEEDPSIREDPVKLAQLQEEIVKMDKASFDGTPEEGFFVDPKKTFAVARMKLQYIVGHEQGFGNTGIGRGVISTSLTEGWKPEDLPKLINSTRSGSHSRGVQTELGGAGVKLMNQVFQNTSIVMEDCESPLGSPRVMTHDNIPLWVGHYRFMDDGSVKESTVEDLNNLLGQTVVFRAPTACRAPAPSYCAVCIGKRYSQNWDGLTTAASNMMSSIMYIFMSAFHGKAAVTTRINLDTAIT